MWSLSLGALGAAVTGMILANTDLFLVKPEEATLEFLEKIQLKTLGQGKTQRPGLYCKWLALYHACICINVCNFS